MQWWEKEDGSPLQLDQFAVQFAIVYGLPILLEDLVAFCSYIYLHEETVKINILVTCGQTHILRNVCVLKCSMIHRSVIILMALYINYICLHLSLGLA